MGGNIRPHIEGRAGPVPWRPAVCHAAQGQAPGKCAATCPEAWERAPRTGAAAKPAAMPSDRSGQSSAQLAKINDHLLIYRTYRMYIYTCVKACVETRERVGFERCEEHVTLNR